MERGSLENSLRLLEFFFSFFSFLTDYSNVSETLGVVTCMTIGLYY